MPEHVKKKLLEEIKALEHELAHELPKEIKKGVAFGSIIEVFDNTKDEKIEYTLVTSEESDVTLGKISTTSPIGKSLMGKRVGDVVEVVTPTGKRELEILKLATIHDQEQAESNGASGGH